MFYLSVHNNRMKIYFYIYFIIKIVSVSQHPQLEPMNKMKNIEYSFKSQYKHH